MIGAEADAYLQHVAIACGGGVRKRHDEGLELVAPVSLRAKRRGVPTAKVEIFPAGTRIPEVMDTSERIVGRQRVHAAIGCGFRSTKLRHQISTHISPRIVYAASTRPARSSAISRATAGGSKSPRLRTVPFDSVSSTSSRKSRRSHWRSGAPNPVFGRVSMAGGR